MAKKKKMKISKVKKTNQTTNKMKKQGKLKLQRHKSKPQKQKSSVQPQVEYSSDSSSSGDEWKDMLDEEEQNYILNRLSKEPRLLTGLSENVQEEMKPSKKRKRTKEKPVKNLKLDDSGAEEASGSGSDLEDKYEQELAERPAKRLRPLLPIKTKHGLEERNEEYEESENEAKDVINELREDGQKDHSSDMESDSGLEGTGEEADIVDEEVVSTVQLLALRREKLNHEKLRIGALCSSLLENPEKKLKNFYPILYLMEEKLKDGALNLHSVRKLATISACEVFKDILPDYMIRHQDYSNVKLKKDTLALYKYEKELLDFYKRYLQRLEKATTVLRRKKGDTRKPCPSTMELALVSLECMCGLLCARPYFNWSSNVAQSVVPLLDAAPAARAHVSRCLSLVFTDDNKGDITLTIVRLINQLVKKRGERLNPEALDCLLSLKIRDVDLNEESELKNKKKKEEKHKKRIVNLSKKEKKRAKKLKEVERELLETEAQENAAARKKQLTEVTKTVFHIYFRLLKTAPRSKLLSATLQGLAKFTHVINLEYYTDLVNILAGLLQDEDVSARGRLQCASTALGVLSGAGDALPLDPAVFHAHLYHHALNVHIGSPVEDVRLVVDGIRHVTARARRVSSAVLAAFGKRLATLSTQLGHNGALACLHLLYQLTQHSKVVQSLLDPEGAGEGACGRYCGLSHSPEHCGAEAATLYELVALRGHMHPTVRELATALASRQSIPAALRKSSPIDILEQYDGSQMAFKPSIPPPKPVSKENRKIKHTNTWHSSALKEYCEGVENNIDLSDVANYNLTQRDTINFR